MKSLFPQKYHTYIYYFALTILAIGLPVSKFLMSISQLILLGNWLLEGNLRNKIIDFWKNKPALVVSSILVLHFIGLLYTSNYADAFLDIRVKLPLFILPLIISTSDSLPEKLFNGILKLFVASVIFGTIVSTLILFGFIHRPIVDIRGISIFISHIRFALLICVGVFISSYFAWLAKKKWSKLVWLLIICWFVTSLVLMESLTGIVILCITVFILLCYRILKIEKRIIKIAILTFIIGLFISSYIYTAGIIQQRNENVDRIDFDKVDRFTSKGNPYTFFPESKLIENGHLIWIYFCDKELKEEWDKRSTIKFEEKDKKGNSLRFTLIRFLASKGLRKDGDAVAALTNEEIVAIERGVPNVNYQSFSSFKKRLYETLWEIELYKNTGDANGHSLTQRFEYWKVALNIINENLLLGVGTGDVQKSFDEAYVNMNSKLAMEWRLHSHNQFLSITVAFGLFGLLWFLLTLIYPMFKLNMTFDYLFITFFIVSTISFFTEDTLETQAGVSFYVFFNSLFLFSRRNS